jgi:glycosyltransferase involved in cell wall biosynthesis
VLWEVIVVNNNSADRTSAVAQEEWSQYSLSVPFAIIDEKRPGLSFAREAGIQQAKFDLIVFCDDDNWLEDDYIQSAYDIMSSDKQIGILGGLNTAIADIELPFWFKDFEHAYACGPQAATDGEVHDRVYITGAGMVIQKKIFYILKKLNFQSQLLDRKGEELTSGGDTEISFVTAILGYKLFYSSKLRLYHYMDAKRLEWSYLLKLVKGHTHSYYKLLFYLNIYKKKEYNRSWLKEFLEKSKMFLKRDGILMIYHYFKCHYKVTDVFSVNKMTELEMWKTHLEMIKGYSKFISYLDDFQYSIQSYHRDNNKPGTLLDQASTQNCS